MQKAFKYRIYPSKTVASRIDETIETCRRVYNRCLAIHNDGYNNGLKLKRNDYYIQTIREPRKDNPFLQQVPAQVLNEVIERMRRNWDNYFKAYRKWKQTGGRKEPMPGPPGFKKRGGYNSFTYPQSGFKLEGNRLAMSMVGSLRVRLHRPIEGNVKTLTVSRKNEKYYVSFSCDLDMQEPLARTGKEVGLDMGIMCFYATSDGEKVDSPRPYKEAEQKLAELKRVKARKKRGSTRRRKAKLRETIAEEKVARIRRDFFFKHANELLRKYDKVYVEDLDIRDMMQKNGKKRKRNRYTKGIVDSAWGTFLLILRHKAEEYGKTLVRVPAMNTTQRCSRCWRLVPKDIHEREHICPYCGLVMDRDVNAAKNILSRGRNELPFGFVSIPDSVDNTGDRQNGQMAAD